MKKTLALVLTLALAFAALFTLVSCACEHVDENLDGLCDKCGAEVEINMDLTGTYNITMWVSELEGVDTLFQSQIDAFEAANPGIVINATIAGQSEGDAATQVIADVATAPDMYCFAQDQLARLVQANALAAPSNAAAETIRAEHDAGSISSVNVGGKLYAYPLTADNGYYMYYDKSVIAESDVDNMTKIIAACEKAGLGLHFELENAWYTASYFFATGCHSTWSMNADGEYTSIDDDFKSENGLIAMKGLREVTQSTSYRNTSSDFTDAAVVVTGIWNAGAAEKAFGENLGVADLPSFTVDGKDYHIGSFCGGKILGVKPQTDVKRAVVLQQLALYLTGETCQAQRFEQLQWGPSNKVVQASDAVKSNPSLSALAQQNAYAVAQGQIHGSWWDIGATLGKEAKAATSDADLQTALDEYRVAIDALFQMSDEQKEAWSVIGSISGTEWGTDFPMTPNADKTVWRSEALDLVEGDEFKVRQGGSWDVNYGADGALNGGNIVVETAGKYVVVLTISGDAVSITLEAAE